MARARAQADFERDDGGFHDWAPALQKSRAYDQILLDIIAGELAPGARLDERMLAARYDAGLAGVRDALGRLALEGMVVRRARSGTTVAPMDLFDARQAAEARSLIEPHCAALAARHATAADVAALRACFDDAEEIIRRGDRRAVVAMDQRFHVTLARASHNATLARLVIPLQHQTARFWVYSMVGDGPEERRRAIAQHLEVIDCIARGDAEGARAATMRVLGVFAEDVQRVLGGPSSAPSLT
jgi:DNA-binding GntR family transcriptional regulator